VAILRTYDGQTDVANSKWTTYRVNNGTITNMKRHLESAHPVLWAESLVLYPSAGKEEIESDRPFNMQEWLEALIMWIVVDDEVRIFRCIAALVC